MQSVFSTLPKPHFPPPHTNILSPPHNSSSVFVLRLEPLRNVSILTKDYVLSTGEREKKIRLKTTSIMVSSSTLR